MGREISVRSAGGIIIGPDGRVVVVQQIGPGWVGWSLPKGHVDPGEDDLTAAKREIYEECGVIDLTFVRKLPEFQRSRQVADEAGELVTEKKTLAFFLFTTAQTKLEPHDPANPEARWATREEAAELIWNKVDKEFFISIMNTL